MGAQKLSVTEVGPKAQTAPHNKIVLVLQRREQIITLCKSIKSYRLRGLGRELTCATQQDCVGPSAKRTNQINRSAVI